MDPAKLIAHFGDVRKVAEWFGVSPNAVRQWYYRGRLPKDRLDEIKFRLKPNQRAAISRRKPWHPQIKHRSVR